LCQSKADVVEKNAEVAGELAKPCQGFIKLLANWRNMMKDKSQPEYHGEVQKFSYKLLNFQRNFS